MRNRIIEFKTVPSSKLTPHPKNFRNHNDEQKGAMEDILSVVGVAGAGLAYYSKKYGGLTLIDGHMRQSMLSEVPVVILDLNDDEADILLASYDRIGSMADEDLSKLNDIVNDIGTGLKGADYLQRLLDIDRSSISDLEEELDEDGQSKKGDENVKYPIIPQVDEAYDFVLIFCRRGMNFAHLITTLGMNDKLYMDRNGRVGRARVISYEDFMLAWNAKRPVVTLQPEQADANDENDVSDLASLAADE